ncbi:hypothetical protein [Humisphaera borealis]|uniref:Uncharacterized protein n=1 Tax=Humisphaera borealis TaxID=2807512 RepID=A0A7M2WWJ0_9BACT|nr:hypothetical protein [Humisphaera borealis]QOV89759.1 hypothetical protein IPV69_26850 [Humisphaera borealis]
MPLSINVGLSRKASRDYQSTGYSINVTAELDQALLGQWPALRLVTAQTIPYARPTARLWPSPAGRTCPIHRCT